MRTSEKMTLLAQRKQASQEKKDQELSEVYQCECGKSYKYYSALYLHFKRKHSIKISTKFDFEPCKIFQSGSVKVYRYYHSTRVPYLVGQDQYKGGQTMLWKARLMLDEYIAQQTCDQYWVKVMELILQRFFKHVTQKLENQEEDGESISIKNLPHYFNSFILQELNTQKMNVNDFQFQATCMLFLNLAAWMNRNQYCQCIVELNEKFSQSETAE